MIEKGDKGERLKSCEEYRNDRVGDVLLLKLVSIHLCRIETWRLRLGEIEKNSFYCFAGNKWPKRANALKSE